MELKPATPQAPPTERRFRPDIEGVRAVASLGVLLSHAGVTTLAGGFTGVDVFYVLSGFLVTGGLLREGQKTDTIDFWDFMGRRARRLLPVATLVLILTVVFTYRYLGYSRGNVIAEDAKWTSLFASNWRFIQTGTDYFGAQSSVSPLQHYWTLAVEMQFYFVWPLIVLLLVKLLPGISLRLKMAIALVAMFMGSYAWSIYQTETAVTVAYFSTFTRVFEIAAGCLLALAVPCLVGLPGRLAPVLNWGGLALLIFSILYIEPTMPFPGWIAIFPVLAACLVIAGGTIAPDRGAERILNLAPMTALGKYSYGMYLWHWPMLLIAPGVIHRELTVPEKLLVVGLGAIMGIVTYHLVENPLRNVAFLKNRPAYWSLAFGALLVLIPWGISQRYIDAHQEGPAIAMEQAALSDYPSEDEVLAEVANSVDVSDWPDQPPRIENLAYSDECDVTRAATSSSACVHGNPHADRTVVVYGDSHAAMWIPALDIIGKQADWRVIQLNKPGCIAPDFPTYSNVLGREYTECEQYRDWAMGKIEEIQPDVVIVTSARSGSLMAVDGKGTEDGVERAWEEGLGRTVDRITPNAGRVVVLGDMPYPSLPGIDCLSANPNDVERCTDSVEDAVLADHNAVEAKVAEEHGAEYVDITPWFCTDEVCPAVINALTVHRDRMHVSENYAVWLSEVLGNATGLLDSPLD